MGTPAFPDLGKHCSVTSCQQIDFLPFTCDKCRMVFCLSHRMPASHECPCATVGDAVVLLCPLCAKAVRLVGDEDPNVTWARHERSGCDPSNLQRVANKRRCAAQGCKEVLSPANTVTCRDCTRQTCLRHRFGADHACSGIQKNSQPISFWAAGGAYSEKLMAGMQGAMAGLMAPGGGAAGAGSSSGGGASGAGKSAGKNISTGSMASTSTNKGKTSSGSASSSSGSGVGAAANDLNTVRGTAARRQKQGAGQAASAAGSQGRVGSAEPQQPGAGAARAGGGDGGGGPEVWVFEAVPVFLLTSYRPPLPIPLVPFSSSASPPFPSPSRRPPPSPFPRPIPALFLPPCYPRLVYYCCRLCQMQAWRKHRHVCGAAAAAAARIQRTRALLTPSQWRALGEFGDAVRALIPAHLLVPTQPDLVASALLKIAAYVRQRPHLVHQPMADAVWAAALSMRGEGASPRLYMAWAWGFLEAAVESGSVDAFLAALRIDPAAGGAADLPRVNRWMKRGLCQALLMLNKRQEVGAFFRHAPRQQLLYF
ncbi:unnamed protein product [Closterium sp. Naga37s-1]|nr:unnamed protein product [Closterium sp. Naga37s-1]